MGLFLGKISIVLVLENLLQIHFMSLFLSIILFMILLTSWQFMHYQNPAFLNYVFCLLTVWLYFIKDYPEFLLHFFSAEWLSHWIEAKAYYIQITEISLTGLLIWVYTHFFTSFFRIKERKPKYYRIIAYLGQGLICWVLIDWLLLLTVGKVYLNEVIGKTLLAIASPYFLYESYSLVREQLRPINKPKELRVIVLILIGVSSIIITSVLTGFIHLITWDLESYNFFIPMGVLIDILFFYAAIAYFYNLRLGD